MRSRSGSWSHPVRGGVAALVAWVLLASAALTLAAQAAAAQAGSPDPSAAASPLRMTARPLMGGNVRPGSWMGVRVHLENDGPAVRGELRLSDGAQRGSRYSIGVELPTGARQDHLLYAQPSWSGGRLTASLVEGGVSLIDQRVVLTAIDPYTTTIVIVAERPDAVGPGVRGTLAGPGQDMARVLTVAPEDLPPRPEAWAVIDRLVWQDVDPARLTQGQLAAMAGWVGAGGRLVVVGGQAGLAGVAGLPSDLLPFLPTSTIDVPAADLEPLVGALPAGTAPTPALAGDLAHGSVMAWSDGRPIARAAVGQGRVVYRGGPATLPAIAGSPGATGLLGDERCRSAHGPVAQPARAQGRQPDRVAALNSLPAVAARPWAAVRHPRPLHPVSPINPTSCCGASTVASGRG
ncbi:MAG: hypothetical protein R3C32_09760 [Chloroflexota bacterium]